MTTFQVVATHLPDSMCCSWPWPATWPGHRKGQLRPGYDADILAVDGDPLSDPAALHAIRAVYVRGTALTQ